MKILVINGPNLNMLGVREPHFYGAMSYQQLVSAVTEHAQSKNIDVDVKQSNHEGDIVTIIQDAMGVYDGIIINPGAFTHYSYAILDALLSVDIPAVEVHISNIHKREEFRHKSVAVAACEGQICGLGVKGYLLAMDFLESKLSC